MLRHLRSGAMPTSPQWEEITARVKQDDGHTCTGSEAGMNLKVFKLRYHPASSAGCWAVTAATTEVLAVISAKWVAAASSAALLTLTRRPAKLLTHKPSLSPAEAA